MRTRIYKTEKMANGRRFVHSGTPGEWLVFDILKWLLKAIFFCAFFWIIIPVKLLRKIGKR